MTEQAKSSLKWGFSSMGAPEMDLPALADLAARLHCPHIELRTLNGTIDLPAVLEREFASPAAARAVAESRGVEIVALNSSFKLSNADAKQREDLAAFALWADRLGARYIRVFGGGKWGDTMTEDLWRTVRENADWWREAKASHGWKCEIALETHDAFSGSTQCLDLFEQLGAPLPVIWDTHHTWKLAGESVAESWRRFGSHVAHVHIKDSVSRPSDRHPYTYVHPGDGEFPIGEVTELLAGANYRGVVSVEWEKLWHPYLDPLEKALEKARERGLW